MDAREMESLAKRLIQTPHDQEALLAAHQAGQTDPTGYAMFLEKVGNGTTDTALSCHWLTEAANVWLASLGDAPRAARVLMKAIERDPTQSAPGEKLAELYRERGDTKALVALLERRCKAFDTLPAADPSLIAQAAAMREELGRLWSEPPLSQTRKAVDNFKRAIELDSSSQYAIYALRELLKAEHAWADAIPYFELEQRLVDDPERKLALYQDEATVRQSAGDRVGASESLRRARQIEGGADPSLKQLLATMTLERVQAQEQVPEAERSEAGQLFVELAEEYPGEHGLSYSMCALETHPSNDRGVQLAMYYSGELNREAEVVRQVAQYLKSNPSGALAIQAREFVNKLAQAGLVDESILDALAPTADAPAAERVQALLDQANALARRARKPEAAEKYQQVLELDPSCEEAVQFMEGYLRQRRKYPELKDLFRAAAAVEDAPSDNRKQWLRELAGLCESQLRDADGAIAAWQILVTLDPSDGTSLEQLQRLLERAARWDELVVLLEQQASEEDDVERRVAMERSIAKIHEQKRKDPVATGQTWARIASLLTDDESALLSAVKCFERAERLDLAAQCIADNVGTIGDETTRARLFEKLGTLRESQGDWVSAGDAYSEAASTLRTATLFEAAEKCFVEAGSWAQAASVVDDLAQQISVPVDQARLFATVAVYLTRAGDPDGALTRLEQATELDPASDAYAEDLERIYLAAERHDDVVKLLLARAEQLRERELRVSLRRRASQIQRETLQDRDAARESLLLVLADGDDSDALSLLVADAEEREDYLEATEYLHRLAAITTDPQQKIQHLVKEATLIAENLDDAEGAISRYDRILKDHDPKNTACLTAIANLYERLDDSKGVADALERQLALGPENESKLSISRRLADLYEGPLDNPTRAVVMLDTVRELDEEDFDALGRLTTLAEKAADFPRLARHLAEQMSVEGDEGELSRIARQLATLFNEKLDKNDEALSVLMQVADLGDEACREDYVILADKLGWKGIVATKLVEWNIEAQPSEERNLALRGAFDRFLEVDRNVEAATVARELVRVKAADSELAMKLEEIAVKLKDLDTLEVAHDLLVQQLSGSARAEEMVRQAETMMNAGVDVADAIQHGEQALTSVAPADVEPLLERLSKLAQNTDQVIDLYERQVTRCKAPLDRLRALGRAAQVASLNGSIERAKTFFDIALGGTVQEDTMFLLEEVARETDSQLQQLTLRRTLAEAFASGGQGSKDGGRTRSTLLRRAANLAFSELSDENQAFQWLADSIITHVDDEGLNELERLAREVSDMKRAETVLSRALEEVFDGPLVRRLLARRAALRRNELNDVQLAAQDLKRLHDLSPSDHAVTEELTAIYIELGDHRGMVQLFEDQILRGKDPATRAELARKVARLWEEKLGDAREAADAWRRVLRLKQGDPEAAEGLDRAKSNMLRRSPSDSPIAAVPGAFVTAKSATHQPPPVPAAIIQPSPEEPAADTNLQPTDPVPPPVDEDNSPDSNIAAPSPSIGETDASKAETGALAAETETVEVPGPPSISADDSAADDHAAPSISADDSAADDHAVNEEPREPELAPVPVAATSRFDDKTLPDATSDDLAQATETAEETLEAPVAANGENDELSPEPVSATLSEVAAGAPLDERSAPPPPPPPSRGNSLGPSRPPPPLPPRAAGGARPPPPPSLRPVAMPPGIAPGKPPAPPPKPPSSKALGVPKVTTTVAADKAISQNSDAIGEDDDDSLDVDDTELIEGES